MKKRILSALTAVALCCSISVNALADVAIDYVSVNDDGTIKALTITSDSDTNADIFVASYQGGRLIGVSMLDDAAIRSGQDSYDITSDANADEVKIFVWDNNQNPLTDSIAYTDTTVPSMPSPTPECNTQPPSTPTPTVPAETEAPTPTPTLPELEEGVISAFRYLSETAITGFNNGGAAQAMLSASEDGINETAFTMTSGDYTDELLGFMRNTPALAPQTAWGEYPYIQVAFSTKGYTDISVSAKVGATKKGPANYKLQYSTDGEGFTDIAEYSLTTNKILYNAFEKVALEGAEECDTVYVRITPNGTGTINGGTLTEASGEFAVNDILIYGTATGTPTAEPVATPTPAPTPEGDGIIHLLGDSINADGVANAVVSGTTVTLTAAGTYTIEGTLNDGQILVESADKDDELVINLNGVSVTNSDNAPFCGTKGKVELLLSGDNTFTETNASEATDRENAALFNKHDLTIKPQDTAEGTPSLTVNASYNNGIRTKKDLEIGAVNVNVTSTAGNGIKGDESIKFTKKAETITVTAAGDAIKTDYLPELTTSTDETTGEEITELEGGTITINGGTFVLNAQDGDGIQADMLLEIKNGTLDITATGEGIKANASTVEQYADAEAVVAEGGDGCIAISGGDITVDAGEDGVKATKSFEMSGGKLTVEKSLDGIQTGDYVALSASEIYSVAGNVSITGGEINVTASEDGINTSQLFTMTDGAVTVASANDGIQAGEKLTALDIGTGTDDETAVYSVNGTAFIAGGTINVTAGGGHTGAVNQEIDYSCKGIKSNHLLKITGGDITVDSLDDCIHSDDTVRISGGNLILEADDDGVHGDSYLYISDSANINVKASYEGIEAAEIYISGGTTYVKASDDGANAAGDQPTHTAPDYEAVAMLSLANEAEGTESYYTEISLELYAGWNQGPGWGGEDTATYGYIELTDGLLYIVAGGDGFDSNGSAVISGGTLLVNGPTSGGNGVFDIGDGSNYTLSITGGTVVGVGTKDMAVTPNTTNGKAYILSGGSGSSMGGGGRPGQSSSSSLGVSGNADTVFNIKDSSGNEIMSYKTPVSYQWIFVMTPEMTANASYTFTNGGTYSGGAVEKGLDGYGILAGGTYSGGTSTTLTSASK